MEVIYLNPNLMLKNVEHELDRIPNKEVFNNPKHQKLLEAWCASMFAIGYSKFINVCDVAVNETKLNMEADFYIKTEFNEWPFQLTEVQSADRKRGKEYKEKEENLLPYRPAKENKNAIKWIYESINKKHLKSYSKSEELNLVVYVNFEVGELNHEELISSINVFKGKFSSIWLLTNTYICSLYSFESLGEIPGWGEVRSLESYYV